jgi:hypothetical protein
VREDLVGVTMIEAANPAAQSFMPTVNSLSSPLVSIAGMFADTFPL